MKKAFLTLLFLLGLALPARAQIGNTSTILFPGAPSGTCAPLSFGINTATGSLYDCLAGTWTLVGTAGGGATPGGATGTIQYNAGSGSFGGVSGLTQGIGTDCDGFGGGCAMKYVQPSGGDYNDIVSVPDGAGMGSYAAIWSGAEMDGDIIRKIDVYDGSDYTVLTISSDPLVGVSTARFLGTNFVSSTASPATTGTLRLANADLIGWLNSAAANATLSLDSGDHITASNGATGYLGPKYFTTSNCSDSAGAAACGSASAGSVVVDAGATTVVVSTTAVSANSQIFVMYDSSLGTRLSVTCNATVGLPSVTARTAATSFTITIPAAPVTNPECLSFLVVN